MCAVQNLKANSKKRAAQKMSIKVLKSLGTLEAVCGTTSSSSLWERIASVALLAFDFAFVSSAQLETEYAEQF